MRGSRTIPFSFRFGSGSRLTMPGQSTGPPPGYDFNIGVFSLSFTEQVRDGSNGSVSKRYHGSCEMTRLLA